MSRWIIYCLVFTALLAGCGSLLPEAAPTAPSTEPAPQSASPGPLELGQPWTIKMQHSGGIMGLSRVIEISSDGRYSITDERTNQSMAGQLTAAEMSQLRRLITSARLAQVVQPGQPPCADCFVYHLEIDSTGGPFEIELNDITLPESGLEPMIMYLRELMERSLT